MSGEGGEHKPGARAGQWVEIGRVLLEPGQRATQVPADTQGVALEMRVKGVALHDGETGQAMSISTPTGRRLSGILMQVEPAYTHGFGAPVPELLGVGVELRELLSRSEGNDD